MSCTEEVSARAPFVMRDKNYAFDKGLKIIRSKEWEEPGDISELRHGPPATFPSLKTFANLANVAYFKHGEDGKIICPPKDEVQWDGFTFLAAANNLAKWNGYYGIAYVNEERRQIILSHRGTSNFGAIYADGNGILLKKFVPQVSSAMTFAHEVVDHALKRCYEFFFTGHSLGAWLAQITTFSTMYLTLDEDTVHFVGKQSPHSDVRMPYTVVFDSPGALNNLTLLKQALFHLHVESTQEISVETLPVEVFLFHPNYVNFLDFHIGRVFILDVEKVGVVTNKYFGRGTHEMVQVVKLLNELGEKDAVKWRVTDYRVTTTEMVKNSWSGENKTGEWDRNSFPAYFFSPEERKFLERAKDDFPPKGQFEGVNWKDEEMANSLLKVTNEISLWKLTGGEKSVVTADGWDRSEFIPRVRHTFRCLRQRGTLWWNPTRSKLPTNYVDRRMCPTAKLNDFTALRANEQEEQNVIEELSVTEVLMTKARLVLFVDPPGMGKSSAMTELEMQLRSKVPPSPRVVVRLNLNQVQHTLLTLTSQGSDMKTPDKSYNLMNFIEKFLKNIPASLLQQTMHVGGLPLYVLLDGLDEVCPEYKQIMTRILQSLLSDTPQDLFSVHKVILTSRPHLQKLIENQFSVKANSLLPLKYEEQVVFLKREVGLSFVDAHKSLFSLPSTARSLMGNPLMLSLYAQVLKFHGTEAVVNMIDLYSKFVGAKHKLHVVEKEEAEGAKMSTQRRVSSMLDDNLKFYFACAVEELVGIRSIKTTKTAILGKRRASELNGWFLEQPTGKKLDELISYGLLVSGGRFKHRSFAEFFYAQLLTTEANEYKTFREVLFGRMYEDKVNENVERFLREILLRRQAERRGRESPESFPEFHLREEEAALYLGKERLERMVNVWIDSLVDFWRLFGFLLREMEKPSERRYDGPSLIRPLKNVGVELAGADDKESALRQFYEGSLFVFLCGRSVLLCLDYSQPEIFESLKSDRYAFGLFWRWLCGLEDRSWVRAKVFGMKEESVAGGGGCWWWGKKLKKWYSSLKSNRGHLWECSAEVIWMFAVRTDDVSQFLSHEEISAALNSLDSVVDDHWRLEEVEVEKVRRTLEKHVDPPRLQRSLISHLTTVDDILLSRHPDNDNRHEIDFRWSWWYAEVFSRSEVLSFVSPYASRAPNIPGTGWRAVQDAWGEEFVPSYEAKILLRIKEGDLVLTSNLWDEVERGGLKLDGDLMDAVREMIFGDTSGWEVLEMLERRLVRHVGTNVNTCLSATNLLEQLFEFEDIGTKLLDTLRFPKNFRISYRGEQSVLWAWLPFVVRYSGELESIKWIIARLSSLTKTLDEDNFASAARSFLAAHSVDGAGSAFVCQLVRSFLGGLKTEPPSLLNVLMDADEVELRTLFKQNSHGTPPTVTQIPLLTYFLSKNKSTSDESKSTPPWRPPMDSSWDAESAAYILTALIETSLCSELPRSLGNFLSSLTPDLLKKTLLSKTLYEYFKSKCRVQFRNYVFVNTEGMCRLCATIRYYLVVFGEDLEWVEHGGYVDLLTKMPVEILSVLEDKQESSVGGFPPLQIGTKLNMVKTLEQMLRHKIGHRITLSWLAKKFSYQTEADWVWLLQALQLIPLQTNPTGCTTIAVIDHIHHYLDIVDSRVLLIRVWATHFGVEETRRAADEQKLWGWLRKKEQVPRGEDLQVAVEVGSLEGVKTLAWPGLLKWTNKGGKTAGEVSVELWGAHHEISQFLEERFQAVRAFHEEP